MVSLRCTALFMELIYLLSASVAYHFPQLQNVMRHKLSLSNDAATGEVPAESEWKGAKKICMKDRSIKTIFNIEQISKILPQRYPFLLVDTVRSSSLNLEKKL